MATIGYATLQIIPSLLGVTEAIEKQIAGQVVPVTIEPKVDKRAIEKAGKQTRETIEKQTKQVTVEPKVDQAAAKKAGKQAGKTVGDEMASSVKSSAGKEAAKAIVDGIADGVKQEMPRGGVGEAILDGLAEGVKQGIDGVGIGGQVVTTISTGIKSGNLGGAIKDAVIPALKNIGDEIRSGASDWAGNIADSLRSGDIQGATKDIGDTVRNTTDLIAGIGSTFGLQLDGVREFGDKAATTLSKVGTDIQGVITTGTDLKDTFGTIGNVLETVLPGKAGKGAKAISAALASISIPAAIAAFLIYEGGKVGGKTLENAINDVGPDTEAGKNILNQATAPGMGVPGASRDPIFAAPTAPPIDDRYRGKPGRAAGGMIVGPGTGTSDSILAMLSDGEYVIKASSTSGIENAMPGLLDYLNNNGSLPMGFAGGGIVSLGNISGAGITTGEQQSMWDAVRGKFPAAVLSSATRSVMTEGHPDFHNAGRAIDISGPGMGAIASWIASTYPESLELIHSPFGNNIKNGKNVGNGNDFYGAGLMAAHANHVHWALGKSATPSAVKKPETASPSADSGSAESSANSGAAPISAAPDTAAASSASSGITLASSFSGLSATGGDMLGKLSPVSSPDGKSQSLDKIGSAVGQVASGQVSSALSTFGVGDSPGWLKGLSTFASGMKIGGGAGGMAPVSAAPAVTAASGAINGVVHGGGGQPGPQVTYNVRTATVEDAFLETQRIEKERAATNLARF